MTSAKRTLIHSTWALRLEETARIPSHYRRRYFTRGHQQQLFAIRRQSSAAASSSGPGGLCLYNSLQGKVEKLATKSDKGLLVYTCGPTVYAPTHLGHARTYVLLDILRRVMEREAQCQGQPKPLFVMNITDVDDKILAAAEENGEAPLQLARRFENQFWKDMDALNCLRPQVVTRVTEYVESDIIPYIESLLNKGFAYETPDGVYFSVGAFERSSSFTRYGKLAPPTNAEDFYNRSEVETGMKRDRRDFSLWKRQKPGEQMYWKSPWGEGRPGWHIECSAMIEAVGKQFRDSHELSLHAGGIDLKFPHHTNEIAQAEAFSGRSDWIPHWVHTGHLHIDGRKMSKSLKNFVTVSEILGNCSDSTLASPVDDFRLWCLGLSGSYRGSATYSVDRMHQARDVRDKIVRALTDSCQFLDLSEPCHSVKMRPEDQEFIKLSEQSLKNSLSHLWNDMDGPSCLLSIIDVVEFLKNYCNGAMVNPFAIHHVSLQLREHLRLLGFTEKTCWAGFMDYGARSLLHGGESKLLREVAIFRNSVRLEAVRGLSDPSSKSQYESILKLCDKLRDETLPSMGVEITDHETASNPDSGPLWQYCIPRSPKDIDGDSPVHKNKVKKFAVDVQSISLKDYLKSGPYEGKYSDFDANGVPFKNNDGSDLSKRERKKLEKKLERHRKRLKEEK